MKSTRYPESASAAAVVSPTAATFVDGGTRVPWLDRTSTVVALVTTNHSKAPASRSRSASLSADGSSVEAKLMRGAITGTAPCARNDAAT